LGIKVSARKDPSDAAREGLFCTPEGKDNGGAQKQPGGGQQRKNLNPVT